MNKGIQKIIKILEHPRHKQIHGDLIKFKGITSFLQLSPKTRRKYISNKNIIGKCALGEIGCQIGIKPFDLFAMNLDPRNYIHIMKKIGLPKELISGFNLPSLKIDHIKFNSNYKICYSKNNIRVDVNTNESCSDKKCHIEGGHNLDNYIYILNDNGFTYKQIVEFLKITFGDIE